MSETPTALAEPTTRRRVSVISDRDFGYYLAEPTERATSLHLAIRALPIEERKDLRFRLVEAEHPDVNVYCFGILDLLAAGVYEGRTLEIVGRERAVDFVTDYLRNERGKYETA